MLEELGKRSVEADPILDRLHLGPVAGDLTKTDFVHMFGGQRQSRVLLDQRPIEFRSAAHVHQTGALASARQIFVAKEIAQSPVSGVDIVDDGSPVRKAKPLAFGFGHLFREIEDRPEQRRFFR